MIWSPFHYVFPLYLLVCIFHLLLHYHNYFWGECSQLRVGQILSSRRELSFQASSAHFLPLPSHLPSLHTLATFFYSTVLQNNLSWNQSHFIGVTSIWTSKCDFLVVKNSSHTFADDYLGLFRGHSLKYLLIHPTKITSLLYCSLDDLLVFQMSLKEVLSVSATA